jgi:sigma-E factor negative regulatory protein RseA
MMSDHPFEPDEFKKQSLSVLADGEGDAQDLRRICAAWHEGAGLRSTWRAYHLIGDVLRSQELAAFPAHDERFLERLQKRLAAEPVMISSQPTRMAKVVAEPQRCVWLAPLAVAAGFVAVAGMLVTSRVTETPARTPAMALALPVERTVVPNAPGSEVFSEVGLDPAVDADLLRNTQLEQYLAAHRQFGGSAFVSVPGATLRNAAAFVPER